MSNSHVSLSGQHGIACALSFRHITANLMSWISRKTWPSSSKLARHVLALANSGGGCLVVGVEQAADNTFTPVGMKGLVDKSEIHKGIAKYIPAQLKNEVLDFSLMPQSTPHWWGRNFKSSLSRTNRNICLLVESSSGAILM